MQSHDEEISLKKYLFPFTPVKAVVILCLIGFIVYFTMLFNGFVWDDFVFILNNPELQRVSIPFAFGKNFFNNSGYYSPLPELYFSIAYSLFGTQAQFYHFIQLFLHLACTVALFFFFKKFFRVSISFILSLIFLVHPINVEAVSFIASSRSQMVFLSGMCALLVVFSNKQLKTTNIFASFFLLISLLTKETGVIFIFIFLVYTFFYQRKELLTRIACSLSVIGIYLVVRFGYGHVWVDKMGYVPISQLSLSERLSNVPVIIFYYIKTLFFPLTLAIDQQWVVTQITIQSFFLPLLIDVLLLVCFCGFGIFLYKKKRPSFIQFCFFALFFLSSFSMLLQIFPLDMTVADRWFYVPFIGILGIGGLLFQQLENRISKQSLYVILGCIIVLLSIRTVVRNSDWYNLMTLYSHDVMIEDSFDNEDNYAVILSQAGDTKAALPHFLKATREYPTEFSLRNTGMAYLVLNDKEKALFYLKKTFAAKSYVLPPHHHQTATYDSIGRYYLITKDYANAEKILSEGIHDYPEAYTLWYLKAVTDYMGGNKSEALKSSEKAYELYKSPETNSLYTALKNNLPLPVQISN